MTLLLRIGVNTPNTSYGQSEKRLKYIEKIVKEFTLKLMFGVNTEIEVTINDNPIISKTVIFLVFFNGDVVPGGRFMFEF